MARRSSTARPPAFRQVSAHEIAAQRIKRRLYMERLGTIEATLLGYQPMGFDERTYKAEFEEALEWSAKNARLFMAPLDDQYSDPLSIVEELARNKADWETIIASILYPAARPIAQGKGLNKEALNQIQLKYGKRIRKLVERTHYFKANNLPLSAVDVDDEYIDADERKSILENIRLFRLMSLWAAHDPRAILIRAAQLAVNFQEEIDTPGKTEPLVLKRLIMNAEYVYSDLTHIAGYGQMRNRLRNFCYRLKDPQGIADAHRQIRELVSEDDGNEIKERITRYLEDQFNWRHGTHFTVSFRPKEAVEAYAKCKRQNKPISELADLYGIRVMLRFPAIETSEEGSKLKELTEENRRWALDEFGKLSLDVHGRLSKLHGRGNKRNTHTKINPVTGHEEAYSYIQRRLAELAEKEPRDTDPVRIEDPERYELEKKRYKSVADRCLDDCITLPMASGLSLIKDKFFFFLRGRDKATEVEVQIVDPLRHDMNEYGPRVGRFFYKAGLAQYVDSVMAWRALVTQEFQGPIAKALRYVYVSDSAGKVYDISTNPTVAGFLEAAGLTEKVSRVGIESIFGERRVGQTYTPRKGLFNGATIRPLLKLA